MNKLRLVGWLYLVGMGILACSLTRSTPPAEPAQPSAPTVPEPGSTALPLSASPTADGVQPGAAIQIMEPGPGSRLISPLRVAGIADPTFEQHLAVRLVLEDGSDLALQSATIQAEWGQRGPFQTEVAFNLSVERNALIQVYDVSPRDGGISYLVSVGVTLAPQGPVRIRPAPAAAEAIQIHHPLPGEALVGGVAQVEGFGLASFEGTLVIEIHDAEGSLVGSMPIVVAAPEMGQPGRFSAEVPYAVSEQGPGRVVVLDPLPAFNGVGHIASVEVILGP